ncbi:helix-turn-helix transcriptional regulator, partial [uncultured Bilophila sp.]
MVQFEAKLTLPEIGYVRPKQVSYIMGVSRATLYNWIKAGKLPKPERLGARMVAWP